MAVKGAGGKARPVQDIFDSESFVAPLREHGTGGRDELIELRESSASRHG
jgi:hypothetical protein